MIFFHGACIFNKWVGTEVKVGPDCLDSKQQCIKYINVPGSFSGDSKN